MLPRSGSRCSTTTKGKPQPGSTFGNKRLSASTPPADAPMPITGKSVRPALLGGSLVQTRELSASSGIACILPGFAALDGRHVITQQAANDLGILVIATGA